MEGMIGTLNIPLYEAYRRILPRSLFAHWADARYTEGGYKTRQFYKLKKGVIFLHHHFKRYCLYRTVVQR